MRKKEFWRLLSIREAAGRLGVTSSTLQRWTDGGGVPFYRTLGGHRRFCPDALRTFARARGLPYRDEAVSTSADR